MATPPETIFLGEAAAVAEPQSLKTAMDSTTDTDGELGFSTPSDESRKPSRWHQARTLAAAFIINFIVGGLLFSFGIYQALYQSMTNEETTPFHGASSAEIGLIGTLSVSVMTILAPFAVAWTHHLSPQVVVCSGGVLFGLANVLTSFGKALWHFQLAQGLLLGVGSCLAYMPSMTVAPTWFTARRALAMGIVSSGTGIGGLIWAPVTDACIKSMDFRDTLRLTGALAAALICAAGAALDWEPSTVTAPKTNDSKTVRLQGFFRGLLPGWEIAKQRTFIAQALGAALQSAAYYTPVFFLASYAKTLGYSDSDGANFTAVSNACNAIGKISVGLLADRVGRLNLFFLTTFLSAAVTLGLWVPSTVVGVAHPALGKALFLGFTVLYGLFASAYVSLFPAALVELFGLQQLRHVSGVMYMVQGMAALVGTPVAGVTVRGSAAVEASDDYTWMAVVVGALLFATTGAVAWVRGEVMMSHRVGRRLEWKA
ncbi:MFS general substrate transporter [Coniochaeta ligniaria NRRL 30616]|uniref:MFS general substrate transporter n=1 Tax=Coniochaeta ligniaria NRRL 30616 TaxID=1408157 RepID=A0A1J7I5Q7_9PEZI|nr:MFS general substrate transporter [Coniochaeta ligniaria NRRL 30616]